jgi:zinc protease
MRLQLAPALIDQGTQMNKSGFLMPAVLLLFAASANFAYAALPIAQWQNARGTRIFFVETHVLPMVDVAVEFSAGSSRDVAAKSGTAALVQQMLQLGTQALSEDQIARQLADVGANLNGRFDADRAGYWLRTLSSAREREASVKVLAQVLQQPVFPEAVLDRERARIIASLKEADTKPETLAARAFWQGVYGTHPYALRSSGETQTVADISRSDLENFYRAHYVANEAVVAIIGDVTRAEADAIAEKITAELPVGRAATAMPAVSPLTEAVVRTVAHPSSQAHIIVGAPGIARVDPDYFPLWVGNYILGGGGFASRISEEVRQKRGLAYSAYSYFYPLAAQGPFQMGLQTKSSQAAEALKVVRETLEKFLRDGPTARELEEAKQNIIGGFPLRIDSNSKILEYLSTIGFYKLPLDYLEQFPKRVEAVTVEQIHEAFSRRIAADRMVTVVVGGDGRI